MMLWTMLLISLFSPGHADPMMIRISDRLKTLMILASRPGEWKNPENAKTIEGVMSALKKDFHEITAGRAGAGHFDPVSRLIAPEAESVLDLSRTSLRTGHGDYSLKTFRSILSYCLACHSLHGGIPGASDPDLPGIHSLSRLDQARYHAALRNFDQSLMEYQKIALESFRSPEDSPDGDLAIREGASILIRTLQTPERALLWLRPIAESISTPDSWKQDLKTWMRDLNAWKRERVPPFDGSSPKSVDLARKWIAGAEKNRKYLYDHSTDIRLHRAERVLESYLEKNPDGKRAPEAIFLLGRAMETTALPAVEFLPESLYSSCIKRSGPSPQAVRCYEKLERLVTAGFTGSGGVHLPEEVKETLRKLKLQSEPEKKTIKPLGRSRNLP